MKLPIDIRDYKKQRNYAANLNKNTNFEYFSQCDCELYTVNLIFQINIVMITRLIMMVY